MPTKYPVLMRVLHWLMALLIFAMVAGGWYMAGLADDAANKYDFYPWHKSFGVLVLVLLSVRVLTRLIVTSKKGIPPAPQGLAPWEQLSSKLAHAGLYVLMLAVPASGYVMSSAFPYGKGIDFFWWKLPDVVEKSKALSDAVHEWHGTLAWALFSLAIIHLLAVIKHKFFDKAGVDVLPRMWR